MINPLLTKHAYDRYRERFDPLASNAEIERAILTGFVTHWLEQGATRVLYGWMELVMRGGRIITVIRRQSMSKGFSSRDDHSFSEEAA